MVSPAAIKPVPQSEVPPTRKMVRDILGFEPSGPAQEAILNTTAWGIIVSGGEQVGKSEILAQLVTERVPSRWVLEHPLIVWLVGETYYETQKEYDYLVSKFLKLGWLQPGNYSRAAADKRRSMTLDDGTVITTLSSAEESRIAHESPHIIACCEAGKVSEEAFYRMRSAVSRTASPRAAGCSS